MRSSIEEVADLHDLVESTAAVIFLGTPHRGSQELAAMGEFIRHIASAFRMETASAILDALGLKSTDLERAQETFSALWQKYDFRVKTFQEGLGLTGINLGVLGNKVVPDYSSTIGDHRERAESLQANHKDMCRFSGFDDPNYIKFAGELRFMYHSIDELDSKQIRKGNGKKHSRSTASMVSSTKGSKGPLLYTPVNIEKLCLQSLWFPSILNRHRNLETPAERTCDWLFKHPVYLDWQLGRKREEHQGLLWLKGNPGTGKSVLMKEAFRRAIESPSDKDQLTAAFFFNANGTVMEACELGMLQSLLFQLLAKDRTSLRLLQDLYEQRTMYTMQNSRVEWVQQEMQAIFRSAFVTKETSARTSLKRTVIFIDALDECNANELRQIVYFWREVTRTAHGNGLMLNVCISSRHFPSIGISDCPEIVMEHHNSLDIATYVEQRFSLGTLPQDPRWRLLRNKILEKASGVFLWTVLVIDDVLSEWDDGKTISFLLKKVDSIPPVLKELFIQMFDKISITDQQMTVRLFEWALFAVRPLRLHEWHHILAFIRYPAPTSLAEWRKSDHHTETDEQLEKQIRRISRGLLEVSRACPDDVINANLDAESTCAGAGSLAIDHGGTRIVQVIHESVHDLFSSGEGFQALGGLHYPDGGCHLSIMSMCLDYLSIKELDALVLARTKAGRGAQVGIAPDNISMNDNVSGSNSVRSLMSSAGADKRSQKFGKQQRLGILIPEGKDDLGRPAVFEVLKMSHQSAAGIDIHDWLEMDGNISDGVLPNPSFHTTSLPPTSAISQVLEDYPALLSYATSELFTHAQNAHNNGRSLDNVLHRLNDLGTWERWKILKEDVPHHVTLEQYVRKIGLGVLPLMRPSAESPTFSQQHVIDLSERQGAWHTTSPKLLPSTSKQIGKRSSSVASFSSAGSHRGPVFEDSTYSDLSNVVPGGGTNVEVGSRTCGSLQSDDEFPLKRCQDDGLIGTAGVRMNVEDKQLLRRHLKRRLSTGSFEPRLSTGSFEPRLSTGSFEPPAPLLSHGLFRMLQSNADSQSLYRRYADLLDPPDLFGPLSEEQAPPPEEDHNPSDPDLVPREQELRFEGDLFTPAWVRGHGNKREGWCGICKPGRWLVLKNSAYWYDKTFSHGISSASGRPFQEPLETRRMDGNPDVWEGLCDSCNEWIALVSSKKKGTTWFRHAYKVQGKSMAKLYAKELELTRHDSATRITRTRTLLRGDGKFNIMVFFPYIKKELPNPIYGKLRHWCMGTQRMCKYSQSNSPSTLDARWLLATPSRFERLRHQAEIDAHAVLIPESPLGFLPNFCRLVPAHLIISAHPPSKPFPTLKSRRNRNPATMTRSPWGVKLNWEPSTGWGFVFSVLGVNLVKIGLAGAFAAASAASGIGLAGLSAFMISQALYHWALSNFSGAIVSIETIISDREREGLDADRVYVAICGPSGSGKSSLINALRGLLNADTNAASVGTTETTRERQEYQSAACFDCLTLVDFPGAGTQRVPSQGYFNANKLHCYDYILIICGERFGEIEIALVQACIVQGKRFAIVRSRSDEAIRRVEDDRGLPLDEAKLSYIQDETNAIEEELRRASLPKENIVELLGFFILVNKNTLRRLTNMPPYDWPRAFGNDEIHERKLLQLLGKVGVADEHVNPGAEGD